MGNIDLEIKQDKDQADAAEIFVKALVNKIERNFILDTGCGNTSLIYDDFSSELPKKDEKESPGVFGSANFDLVEASSIGIGGFSKEKILLSRMAKGLKGHNLLGMDFLKDFKLTLMINEKKMIIDSKDTVFSFENENTIYSDENNVPLIELSYGDKTTKVIWDTGAGITCVDISFIKKNSRLFEKAGKSEGTDSTGTTMSVPTYLMKEVSIGGYSFPEHFVAGVDFSHLKPKLETPFDIVLGYGILSKANWHFDFPNKKWTILNMIK